MEALKSIRRPKAPLKKSWIAAVLALALGLAAASAGLVGCRAIESGADALADATAGSSVSNVFRGTARMAEGMREYSTSEEHHIGRAVAAEILSRYKVHPDARLNEYVNMVGLAIVYGSPEAKQTFTGYHFTVLDSEEVNAISTPGGFVFLTLGTIKRASTEDELAAVLAHEVGHVSLGHGIAAVQEATRKRSGALLVQGVGESAAAAAKAKGGGGNNAELVELTGLFASAIQDITSELLVKGYSRKKELEADKVATEYLKSSGYLRAALPAYLGRIPSEGGKGGWLSTHPPAQDRIEALGNVSKDDPALAFAGQADRTRRFQIATLKT